MGYQPATIALHVFLPDEEGETTSILHEDDGESFDRRDGAFFRTRFTLKRSGSRITLKAEVSGNGYPEFARKTILLRFFGQQLVHLTLNGQPVHASGNAVAFENAASDFFVEAHLAEPEPLLPCCQP